MASTNLLTDLFNLIWGTFFAWMPTSLQILFGAFVVLAGIFMTIKVIALILDAIPFL